MRFPTRYNFFDRGMMFALFCPEREAMTKQSFKDECDINGIMKRYATTGQLPPNIGLGRYGDFSQVGDYMQAQHVMLKAEEQFKALPSGVRDRFKNSPLEMLRFVTDKSNLEEARKLGLLREVVESKPEIKVAEPKPVEKVEQK